MAAMLPAMQPPPGHQSHFDDPTYDGSNAKQTVVVVSALGVLTAVIMLVRLYLRIWILKSVSWDDC